MQKIILFNGPPRSGKDTATKLLMDSYCHKEFLYHYKFAIPLKDAVHALFGFSGINAVGTEEFDESKGLCKKEFFGMTPREAYIWLSEKVAKPKFGNDFFSKVAISHLERFSIVKDINIIVSDCGFQAEVDTLVNHYGKENVYLIHVLREGASFQGDSRGYVNHIDNRSYVLNNNGSVENLKNEIVKIMGEIAGDGK